MTTAKPILAPATVARGSVASIASVCPAIAELLAQANSVRVFGARVGWCRRQWFADFERRLQALPLLAAEKQEIVVNVKDQLLGVFCHWQCKCRQG